MKYLLAAFALAALPAAARDLELAGRTIAFPVPETYCDFVPQNDAERGMMRTFETLNTGHNQVLFLFVDCTELAALRQAGAGGSLKRYGMYLAPLTENQVKPMPPMQRDAFVRQMSDVMPKIEIGELTGEVRRRAGQAGLDINVQKMGMIDRDADAAYLGIVVGGRGGTISGVVGVTAVKDLSLSINFYRPFENEQGLERLLAEAKPAVRALIAGNESVPVVTPGTGGLKWIIAIVLAAAVVAAAFASKRLFRRKAE